MSNPEPRQPMEDALLATGFAGVDAQADASVYADCLRLLDSLPHFQAYKRRMIDRLDLGPGLRVLDVGCGLGDDVRRLAEIAGRMGLVLGIDASQCLLAQARANRGAVTTAHWCGADARALPLADDTIDRVRVDRVLQHIREPRRAIAEMARVLRPGGRLVAYDNDWGSFALSSDLREATTVLQDVWRASFVNPWIGRDLPRYLLDAGLTELRIEPLVCVIRDIDLADQVYDLLKTLERAAARGLINPTMARDWREEQRQLTASGGFLCSLTSYLVVAVKAGLF